MLRFTPRQLHATLFIARRRRRLLLAEQLAIQTLAARGEQKAVTKQLRDLER